MYSEIKEAAKQPSLWMTVAGFINPVTVGIGLAGLVIYAFIKDDNDKPAKEPLRLTAAQPLPHNPATAKSLTKPLTTAAPTVEVAVESPDAEALKRDILRQHMSALGRKSAAVRARKRLENHG
jgi:hypothetical protein